MDSKKNYWNYQHYFYAFKINIRGHCLMGQLYESMGQLEKAVASYRRYVYELYLCYLNEVLQTFGCIIRSKLQLVVISMKQCV